MSTGAASSDPRVGRLIEVFENLRPATLGQLGELYADEASFKDPFNDVRGLPAIGAIFAHMFDTLRAPRFVVHEAVTEGDRCFLTWTLHFERDGGKPMSIHGATRIEFGADGRITRHRDYWDAAEELYEKLPLLGSLMRWLKQRAAGAPKAGTTA